MYSESLKDSVSVQEEREPMFNYGRNGLEIISRGRFQDLTFDKEGFIDLTGQLLLLGEVLKQILFLERK